MPNPSSHNKPVVLMTMGAQARSGHAYQVMTHKYIKPLVEISGCVPLLVPTCCGTEDLEQYLDLADGVYLSGAGSNIDPSLYGQENLTPEKPQDRDRDLFDIPLVRAALDRGLPLLGICRGMQEINVALGGDIHQKVYCEPGYDDHREDADDRWMSSMARSHQVELVPGTWLAELMGQPSIPVNSLHGRGSRRWPRGWPPGPCRRRADRGDPRSRPLPLSCWRCSGTRSGRPARTPTPSSSSPPLATPAAVQAAGRLVADPCP
nr:gamma-glutamyl-gamma-aminobutyrate hydrolase family protein [Aeromonas caviae]